MLSTGVSDTRQAALPEVQPTAFAKTATIDSIEREALGQHHDRSGR